MESVEQDRRILVAIDFGTTYSAIAWTQTRRPEVQEVINQWPTPFSQGNEGVSSDKVPTEIRYEDDGTFKWGSEILDSQPRHQLFKLELDESKRYKQTHLSQNLTDPRGLPPGYEKSAEQLISDYLTGLRKHIELILRKKIPETALVSTPIEYLVAVPAVWTDNAKAKTKAAAERAGMGKVHMVAEPEAGAVYALHALHPHTIKIGDTFMLVDAGGGTVDVITYKVDELQPMLKISEVTSGAGALCGSSFINRLFQENIKSRLSGNRNWDDDILEEATERFESVIKRTFADVDIEEFQVPVSGLRDNQALGIRRGKLRMVGTEVKEFFKPVVEETIKLIQDQIVAIGHSATTIVLVGGFGQSHYLRSQIQAAVGNSKVMHSPQSWTAVVRGALMMGLASSSSTYQGVRIASRKARKHYGFAWHTKHNKKKHDTSKKFWSPFEGEFRIYVMNWFLNKNDVVHEHRPLCQVFSKEWEDTGTRPGLHALQICSYADPNNLGAPNYPNGSLITFSPKQKSTKG